MKKTTKITKEEVQDELVVELMVTKEEAKDLRECTCGVFVQLPDGEEPAVCECGRKHIR